MKYITKRVTFVDIDGCSVQRGKLNLTLVEQLKSYDEVILLILNALKKSVGTGIFGHVGATAGRPYKSDHSPRFDIPLRADTFKQYK